MMFFGLENATFLEGFLVEVSTNANKRTLGFIMSVAVHWVTCYFSYST